MTCLTEEQLEQHLKKEKWTWRRHVRDCPKCAQRLTEIRLNLELAQEFKSLLHQD